ncbi:MAG: anaerobic sulfatase maturase [Acidimicrobiia bacterium]|nr:anaerobic sulfatase maturase [Acidimicrobiia bacterium]
MTPTRHKHDHTDHKTPSLPAVRPRDAPSDFHVLAKPSGPICNLDCEYCFFLSKEALYSGDRFRMSEEVLDAYLRQLVESQTGPEVEIAWQGGEPTLMGVEFFRHALDVAAGHRRDGQILRHTIQTNGTLLTEEWCELFRDHAFLVGISVDGPRELHDAFRVDKHADPTFDRVMRGVELLRRNDVDFNVLCTVNAANQDRPLDVYRFFRDELDVRHVQLIPIVERDNDTGFQEGDTVTSRSVDPARWGDFLIAIFDEWVRRDVGTMFVSMFDAALASWLGLPAGMCIFAETCGDAVALEHNGDLHACDHFVEPRYLLGNITDTHMLELLASPRQREFGTAKRDTLPRYCRECAVRFACNGECPKNRFTRTPDGEFGLNYLCAGYKTFFEHVDGPMRLMADLLRQGHHADEVMRILTKAPRNGPCPCGSGRKAKLCHAT